jgi:hypothetical protein
MADLPFVKLMSMGTPKKTILAVARAQWDELQKKLDDCDDDAEQLLEQERKALHGSIATAKALVNKLEREALAKLKRG